MGEGLHAGNSQAMTLVLFTGGRDSTAAVLELQRRGERPLLFTGISPFAVGPSLRHLRMEEFSRDRRFSDMEVREQDVVGLIYELVTLSLAKDILSDGRELILLGEFVAILTSAVEFARSRAISRIATGFVRYQAHLPEQHPEMVERLAAFVATHGLELLMPVYDWPEETIRTCLRLHGFSTKSLETTPLFGETAESRVDDYLAVACGYLERKLAIAGEILTKGPGASMGFRDGL